MIPTSVVWNEQLQTYWIKASSNTRKNVAEGKLHNCNSVWVQNLNWRDGKRLAFNFRFIIIIIFPSHRSHYNVSGTVEGCKFLTCAYILINSPDLVPHHKIWKIRNLWNKISTILMAATHWSSLFTVCGIFDMRFHFSWDSFKHGLCSTWSNCLCIKSLKWWHLWT